MSNWTLVDEEPQPDIVTCDGAYEAVSLRFVHDTEPAQVTVTLYVYDRTERGHDSDGYDFDVEEQVEFLLGTDRDDLTGTEVWSDYTYDHPSIRSWETEIEAEDYRDHEVRRWMDMGAEHFLTWDGTV